MGYCGCAGHYTVTATPSSFTVTARTCSTRNARLVSASMVSHVFTLSGSAEALPFVSASRAASRSLQVSRRGRRMGTSPYAARLTAVKKRRSALPARRSLLGGSVPRCRGRSWWLRSPRTRGRPEARPRPHPPRWAHARCDSCSDLRCSVTGIGSNDIRP